MTVLFTKHALTRILDRNFKKSSVVEIVENPKSLFYDRQTQSFVAISSFQYGSKIKLISVFYHEDKGKNKIIHTFHPETQKEIQNRYLKGRYIRIK